MSKTDHTRAPRKHRDDVAADRFGRRQPRPPRRRTATRQSFVAAAIREG